MKAFDAKLFSIGLRYGLIMGAALSAYTLLMWLTGLDSTYLSIGRYFDIAVILVPIAVIFMAIRRARARAPVNIVQRVVLAVIVGLFSFVVYAPVLSGYHKFVSQTWFDHVMTLRGREMAAAGADATAITAEMAKMKAFNQQQSGLLNGLIPSVIVLPIFISLLSLVFVRNREAKEKVDQVSASGRFSEV